MSVYGKTLQNVRGYVNIRLMDKTVEKPLLKAIAKPSYKHTTQYPDSDLVAVHSNKTRVQLKRPAYLGGGVLDF